MLIKPIKYRTLGAEEKAELAANIRRQGQEADIKRIGDRVFTKKGKRKNGKVNGAHDR